MDLRDYDIEDLRRQMAVIFQDFARFAMAVAENVGFGQVDCIHDEARIRQALAQVNTTDLLEKLPDGLTTALGCELGGRELSGGEWQKLALAHASILQGRLMILDEPTAALDAESEEALLAQFRELLNGRTGLIITHRMSTVRMADHIVVLEHGRVIESGSHAQLLA